MSPENGARSWAPGRRFCKNVHDADPHGTLKSVFAGSRLVLPSVTAPADAADKPTAPIASRQRHPDRRAINLTGDLHVGVSLPLTASPLCRRSYTNAPRSRGGFDPATFGPQPNSLGCRCVPKRPQRPHRPRPWTIGSGRIGRSSRYQTGTTTRSGDGGGPEYEAGSQDNREGPGIGPEASTRTGVS